MTKTDELNLSNLMDNIRKVEDATKNDNNSSEIAKIRQYCIDAVCDYNDTNKKICDLINANRDLWNKPHIYGSFDGFVNGKPYHLGEHDFYHGECPFTFETGCFEWDYTLRVYVSGIHGKKKRTGYCRHFEDHDIITKDWKAESVLVLNNCRNEDSPWHYDLIESTFEATNKDGSKTENNKFTVENLKKHNWSIEGWVQLKEKADKTRKHTEATIKTFKELLEKRIEKSNEKLNNLTTSSEMSVYEKVKF